MPWRHQCNFAKVIESITMFLIGFSRLFRSLIVKPISCLWRWLRKLFCGMDDTSQGGDEASIWLDYGDDDDNESDDSSQTIMLEKFFSPVSSIEEIEEERTPQPRDLSLPIIVIEQVIREIRSQQVVAQQAHLSSLNWDKMVERVSNLVEPTPRPSCSQEAQGIKGPEEKQDPPAPPSALSIPTAFPNLGQDSTCNCIAYQGPQLTRGVNNLISRMVWGKTGLHTGVHNPGWLMDSGIEYLRIGSDSKRHFVLEQHPQECGCLTVVLSSFTECHLVLEQSFKEGHDYVTHLTFNCSLNTLHNSFQLNNVWGQNDQKFPDFAGELDNHLPSCPHKAAIKHEVYRGPRGPQLPPIEVQKEDKFIKRERDLLLPHLSSPLPRREQDMITVLLKKWRDLLSIRIREHDRLLGGRAPENWETVVQEVNERWWDIPQISPNFDLVRMEHHEVPHFIKRRLKTHFKTLSIAAGSKGKILANHSFDAQSYQEWEEMDLRRYEDLHELSKSQRVKASSQTAQIWLRTDAAKHWYARVCRLLASNNPYGSKEFDKFNKVFKAYGGLELSHPALTIERIQKREAGFHENRERQLAATSYRLTANKV